MVTEVRGATSQRIDNLGKNIIEAAQGGEQQAKTIKDIVHGIGYHLSAQLPEGVDRSKELARWERPERDLLADVQSIASRLKAMVNQGGTAFIIADSTTRILETCIPASIQAVEAGKITR